MRPHDWIHGQTLYKGGFGMESVTWVRDREIQAQAHTSCSQQARTCIFGAYNRDATFPHRSNGFLPNLMTLAFSSSRFCGQGCAGTRSKSGIYPFLERFVWGKSVFSSFSLHATVPDLISVVLYRQILIPKLLKILSHLYIAREMNF